MNFDLPVVLCQLKKKKSVQNFKVSNLDSYWIVVCSQMV